MADISTLNGVAIANVSKFIGHTLAAGDTVFGGVVAAPPTTWTEEFEAADWQTGWTGFGYSTSMSTDRSAVFTRSNTYAHNGTYGCKLLPTAINQLCSVGYVDLGAAPSRLKMYFKDAGAYIGFGIGGTVNGGDGDYEGGGGVWMSPSNRLYNGGFLATGAPDTTDYSAMTLAADTAYYVIIDYSAADGDMTEVSTVYRVSDDQQMATNTRVYTSYSWSNNLHIAVRDNTETAHYIDSIEVWF